jgi:hypothetical protein
MENMVIEQLFQRLDELRPLIVRAYEAASQDERLLLDQGIPKKFHEIEQWLPGVSIESMYRGMRG